MTPLRKSLLPGLLLGLVALAASAQPGGSSSPPLEGTEWSGHERLESTSSLLVRFESQGKVTLTTPAGTKTGTFTRSGPKVTMNFPGYGGLVYMGQINGTVMGGTAQKQGGQWTWSVDLKNPPPGWQSANTAGTGSAPGSVNRLTEQQLPDYLRKMGFDPKVVTPGVGPAYCVIQQQHAGKGYSVEVSVQNGLWLIVPLAQLPPAEQLAGPKLLRLLEANSTLAPCFFCYRAGDNRLCLKLEVIGGTPNEKDFRSDLGMILGAAADGQDLWGPGNWQGSNPPASPRRDQERKEEG
jgi:hypothetical protein